MDHQQSITRNGSKRTDAASTSMTSDNGSKRIMHRVGSYSDTDCSSYISDSVSDAGSVTSTLSELEILCKSSARGAICGLSGYFCNKGGCQMCISRLREEIMRNRQDCDYSYDDMTITHYNNIA